LTSFTFYNYYMKYTGIPINFGIGVMLGFLIGTAIAGQTSYNFTLETLRYFGTLKVMDTLHLFALFSKKARHRKWLFSN